MLAVIGVKINHAAAIDLPAYIPDKSHFLPNLLPAQPAISVPNILAAPITDIAIPPSAAVVSIPRSPHHPAGSIGALISVTNAGKCAVINASWYPQEKNPTNIIIYVGSLNAISNISLSDSSISSLDALSG